MNKAYVQFSKRIAVAILIFWTIYRTTALILSTVRPELMSGITGMASGVDDVMMVSIGFYTGNSVIEKGIVGYFGRKAQTDTDDNELIQNG